MSTKLIMPAGIANIKELFKGCFVQAVVDGQVYHRAMTEDEKSDVVTAVEMCFSDKKAVNELKDNVKDALLKAVSDAGKTQSQLDEEELEKQLEAEDLAKANASK